MFVIIILNYQELIPAISSIFYEAFNFKSAVSGGLVMVILTGIKRGVFSNEAGVGTEALIHGTATTTHPAKQGLVAMTGPIFDTLIMCTLTAIVILMSGVEHTADRGDRAACRCRRPATRPASADNKINALTCTKDRCLPDPSRGNSASFVCAHTLKAGVPLRSQGIRRHRTAVPQHRCCCRHPQRPKARPAGPPQLAAPAYAG